MTRIAFAIPILALTLTSGCVVAPGTSGRTPQISGRVLSATTHKPVAGANVALHDAPRLRSTTTDTGGRFLLSESRNYHLFVFLGICGPEYNLLSSPGHDIDISHPAYIARSINPWEHARRKSPDITAHHFAEVNDIFLIPKRQ